jgi:UDP-3-O-[3-hydroxymyristoyl] glucosamine N-acyltransferase
MFIGNHVVIGKMFDSPNVAIYDNTIIGNNVVIHAGTVLGADAFYYKSAMLASTIAFRRRIKDNVDIGAFVQSIKELQEIHYRRRNKMIIRCM